MFIAAPHRKPGLRQEAHVTVSGEARSYGMGVFVCQAFVLIRRARDRSDGPTAISVSKTQRRNAVLHQPDIIYLDDFPIHHFEDFTDIHFGTTR